jgi:hypothetical protein
MTDPVISAAPADRHAMAPPGLGRQVEAVATMGGVLTDLVELAQRLPVPADQAEIAARILDRLAEEITEAAAMLRAPARDQQAGDGERP